MQYEKILAFYRKSNNSDERNSALRCLGRSRDPELMKRTLDMLFGGEVKDQDIYMPASGLRTHAEGIEALFEWMTQNWDELVKKLPPTLPMLSSMVQIFTASFTSAKQLEKVEQFFKDKDTKGFDQGLAQSLDSIRGKISWLERDREDVKKWVEANEPAK